MSGRSHTPLFEAMSKGGPSAPAGGGRHGGQSGRVTLPAAALYGIATGVLLLAFLIWTIAFQAGRQSGKQEAIDQFNRGLSRSPDPLLGGGPAAGAGQQAGSQASQPTRQANRTAGAQTGGDRASGVNGSQASAGSGRWLTVRGWIASDPRKTGHNYLKLATAMPGEEAERAIAFLAARGVEAMGVRVDAPAGSANDSGPVDLYSLGLAVPSEQYRAMESARDRHQQLVARLGAEWMARHRGTVDFARTVWERYRG